MKRYFLMEPTDVALYHGNVFEYEPAGERTDFSNWLQAISSKHLAMWDFCKDNCWCIVGSCTPWN